MILFSNANTIAKTRNYCIFDKQFPPCKVPHLLSSIPVILLFYTDSILTKHCSYLDMHILSQQQSNLSIWLQCISPQSLFFSGLDIRVLFRSYCCSSEGVPEVPLVAAIVFYWWEGVIVYWSALHWPFVTGLEQTLLAFLGIFILSIHTPHI